MYYKKKKCIYIISHLVLIQILFNFVWFDRYKGRVTEVLPKQSEFTVSFEDGLRETLEFGKRNVRVLSHLGKHPRS
mgnify:CR=1 FL=1